MDTTNGELDFKSQVALYRRYDDARQQELEKVAEDFVQMKKKLLLLEADLADEKETRQKWRALAQDAESSIRRNQFILILIDGDGYIFKDTYLEDANDAGGARAAHDLCTEVQDYIRERNHDFSGLDLQFMVNIYANRAGLAKHLHEAEMIQHYSQLDQFFQSFTQSQPLFQFVDCGYGKERADAKLRDTYRFFAYNVHCKYIFLACCHDNGYVAELDKYRHDINAAPKTVLIHSAQMGRGYNNLNFPIAHLNVFNTQPLANTRREVVLPTMPIMPRQQSLPVTEEVTSSTSIDAPVTGGLSTWSSITASGIASSSLAPAKKVAKPTTPAATSVNTVDNPSPQLDFIEPTTIIQNKGIPVNRLGQRLDLKIPLPNSQDLDAFEDRISNRKLCNRYHLANDCGTYNCRYDHDPIDAKMKNTLRYKARSIPCQNGPQCRDADCFYGHQCPWGRDRCTNPKCAFVLKGMHNVTELDVARYVPAESYY